MLTQIENEYGVITLNELLVEQIVDDALLPFRGRVWCAHYRGPASALVLRVSGIEALKHREIRQTEKGIYIKVYLIFRFGVPMRSTCSRILDYIGDQIENCLELSVDNIELQITGTLSRKVARRSISFDYNTRQKEKEALL